MTNASAMQVGGNHYATMAVQPAQITYMLGATPMWMNICKYITRDKEDKKQDLEKALHCVMLENEMFEQRCVKYIAEAVPFDHPEIKMFSEQFEDAEFIDEVLQKVYFGYYQQAADAIKAKLEGEDVAES